jgi:hypothetical protein
VAAPAPLMPFFVDHSVMRPSTEMDTSRSPRPWPLSTHMTCDTTSLCEPSSGFTTSCGVPSDSPARACSHKTRAKRERNATVTRDKNTSCRRAMDAPSSRRICK